MELSRTTLKLAAAALGVAALFAAGAAAGINRGEEMRSTGIAASDSNPAAIVTGIADEIRHTL